MKRAPPPARSPTSMRPAVRLDDLARDGEPEAGAARPRGEEGLEDALAQLGPDAGPAVGDVDLDRARVGARARASPTSPPAGTASTAFARSPRSTWQRRSASTATSRHAPGLAARDADPLGVEVVAARRSARSNRSSTATMPAASFGGRANARSELTTLVSRSISAIDEARRVTDGRAVGPLGLGEALRRGADDGERIPHLVRDRGGELAEGGELLLCASRWRVAAISPTCARMIAACARSRRRASTSHPRPKPSIANDEPK